MSTITKKLGAILYGGPALPLAAAPFRSNLNAVYGFNASGTGYTLFKPTSSFNSLTQLVPDGGYIVDAATPGFELPGAVLTAGAGPSSSPMTLENVSLSLVAAGEYEISFDILYGQAFNAPGNPLCLMTVDDNPRFAVIASYGSQLAYVSGDVAAPGSTHTLKVSDSSGNAAEHLFTIPQ